MARDKFLELSKDGVVSLTAGAEYIPDLLKIKDDQDALRVLFFLYSPDSTLEHQFARKKAEFLDKSGKLTRKVSVILKGKEYKAALKVYTDMNVPPLERWLKSAVDKMEECMDFWAKTPTTHDNYQEIAESIQKTNGILDMHNKFKKMIEEDASSKLRYRGRQEQHLFENPDTEPNTD